MRTTTSLVVVFALAALLPRPEAAQSASARREGCLITVGGKRTVLTWALGLSSAADFDQYKQAGLNTVYLHVNNVTPERLSEVSRFASAAEAAGLMVVISLDPRPLRGADGSEVAIDPTDDGYAAAVDSFVRAAVEGIGDHPRRVAWVVEIPAANVVTSDDSFASYLEGWYPSLARLNDSWGTEYDDWSAVTLGAPRDVDSDKREGVGRASLDYAYYRQSVFADALAPWVASIHGADPGTMVLLGSLSDYRSIISAPLTFDGMVLTVFPSVAEADWDTHNVQAVDIARRGNQFVAAQTLDSTQASADQLYQWASLALDHGASAIGFSSWTALRDNEDLSSATAGIRDAVQRQSYPEEPRAQAAILYEPYAGGAQNRAGASLYGYIEGFAPGTPTNLFSAARAGTRYGILDVLDADALTTLNLSQYGAIFAPMAFFLTTDQQIALQNWVLRGGALVVDQGVAMYQADGTVTSMPEVMRAVLSMRHADLTTIQGQPPELDLGETWDPANPGEVRRLSPGQEGKEVDPALTRFVQQIEDFVTRSDVAEYLGDNFVGWSGTGFRVVGLGEGFAVYSPAFLYENWSSADQYFDEFHSRVLSWGSSVEIVDPDATWPDVSATLNDDGSVGVASPYGALVSVLVSGSGNQIYLVPSGVTRVNSSEQGDRGELIFPGATLARAVPLPIYVYPQNEATMVSVAVKRYARDGIELLIAGTDAQPTVQNGQVVMSGGEAAPVEIEIKSGAYGIAADSIHTVTIQQGGLAWTTQKLQLMPNTDAGSLLIDLSAMDTSVTITPSG